MNLTTKLLVSVYLLAAILALLFTWYHVPAYLGHGALQALIAFWQDAIIDTNPASKFIVVDILFLAFVCSMWMLMEGRRLGVRFIYFYVIGGLLIAISVAFPLFMAARELRLSTAESGYRINAYDALAMVVIFASAVAAGVLAI